MWAESGLRGCAAPDGSSSICAGWGGRHCSGGGASCHTSSEAGVVMVGCTVEVVGVGVDRRGRGRCSPQPLQQVFFGRCSGTVG